MRFKIVCGTRWVPPGKAAWVLWPFMLIRYPATNVSERLYRHELQHCYQIKRMGVLRFYFRYLWWAMRKGYRNHPYELEAERAEALPLEEHELTWWYNKEIQL